MDMASAISQSLEKAWCVQVSAGRGHTALLRSNGRATAVGSNGVRQRSFPEPGDSPDFARVSAGKGHTAHLRTDGRTMAVGSN